MNPFSFLLLSIALFVACQSNVETESNDQTAPANTVINSDTIANEANELQENEEMTLVKNEAIEKPKAVAEKETAVKSKKEQSAPTVKKEATEVKPEKKRALEIVKEAPKEEVITENIPNHDNWNNLLTKYVNSTGKVNYVGIKADKASLQSYLDELSANAPKDSWSRNEKLAYWINAYNAFTIKLIIDNYPVASITDLHGGKPWDLKWIIIGDNKYSLNNIENDIIRPKFSDARIHFAVNCAAKSCPPLLNKAFNADKLNSQLEQQSKKFINNVSYNQISTDHITISKIFDWYSVDFGASTINYLNKYANTSIQENATINFKEYDWGLNK